MPEMRSAKLQCIWQLRMDTFREWEGERECVMREGRERGELECERVHEFVSPLPLQGGSRADPLSGGHSSR